MKCRSAAWWAPCWVSVQVRRLIWGSWTGVFRMAEMRDLERFVEAMVVVTESG